MKDLSLRISIRGGNVYHTLLTADAQDSDPNVATHRLARQYGYKRTQESPSLGLDEPEGMLQA